MIEGDDEPRFLCKGDELVWAYEAKNRMLPANEGLDTHNLASAEVDLRLIAQPQLTALDGVVQLALADEPQLREIVHAGGVSLEGVATKLLCSMHRAVSIP